MKKMYTVILPYLIIITLILVSPFLLLKYNYQIRRYSVNKKYPKQVLLLKEDFRHAFNKDNYIDLRNSFKEDFNRIIVINLEYKPSNFNGEYGIKFDELEIELSEKSKANLRKEEYKIEDFQLVMFFNNNELVRYQELKYINRNYHFPATKSKEYKDVYIFTTNKNANFEQLGNLIPCK